ncbi:MAG: uracil-DNA glycosylase [Vicinamibacteria bacterium]|nr:uracil-DNA glycosylase [Vicinamibacteria bacterium]
MEPDSLSKIRDEIVGCQRCPRLRRWCAHAATVKVARYRDQTYWGRPVPGFGDAKARLMIVGLAPAANGGNRTGRVFTGDPSGDFLFPALHRADFANQGTSAWRDDSLAMRDAYILAAVRCAPPANKPEPSETLACRPYLVREMRLLQPRAFLALGKFALDALVAVLRAEGVVEKKRRFPFGHGLSHDLPLSPVTAETRRIFISYHPSQRNTFTGTLTAPMLDAVLKDIQRFLNRP